MPKLLGFAVVLTMLLPAQASPDEVEERVDVSLSSFRFTPDAIRLVHGRRYDLYLVNSSKGGHDFSARKFFAAATLSGVTRSRVQGGRVALHGGEGVILHLTAPPSGVYEVRCSHFLHASMGMHAVINVD